MRVIELSNKVFLVRHWLRWYFVRRGGQDWERVGRPKNRKRTKAFDLNKVTAELSRKNPQPIPSILDELAADREVEKNKPKRT